MCCAASRLLAGWIVSIRSVLAQSRYPGNAFIWFFELLALVLFLSRASGTLILFCFYLNVGVSETRVFLRFFLGRAFWLLDGLGLFASLCQFSHNLILSLQ